MRKLLYPIFGLTVVGGYVGLNVSGYDPFASGTERLQKPPEIRAPAPYVPANTYGGGSSYGGSSYGRRSSSGGGFRWGK